MAKNEDQTQRRKIGQETGNGRCNRLKIIETNERGKRGRAVYFGCAPRGSTARIAVAFSSRGCFPGSLTLPPILPSDLQTQLWRYF